MTARRSLGSGPAALAPAAPLPVVPARLLPVKRAAVDDGQADDVVLVPQGSGQARKRRQLGVPAAVNPTGPDTPALPPRRG
ncbi:hypothetical protein [Streptomyces sp. NPDC002265]|uniref:hypothetical protein n=1 Tax=Streptomyces sp. NPDC002265 TaxID=3154415 RepID=UPI003317E798